MNRRFFIKGSLSAVALTSLGLNFFTACSGKGFLFQKNQRIGCIGDSITAAGGNGYVEVLQSYFDKNYSEYELKFLNLGLNSETITGLTEQDHPGPRPFLFDRLQKILDESNLDVAFFCYGMNCGIYQPPSQDIFHKYQQGVSEFLRAAQKRNIKVILLTPSPLALSEDHRENLKNTKDFSWKNPYPEYDKEVIQTFRKVILDKEHFSILAKIDIHTPLVKNASIAYGEDPIHPNHQGHQIIADTIKDVLLYKTVNMS